MLFENPVIDIQDFSFWYEDHKAVNSVSMQVPRNRTTAIIGASGSGKTTLLKSINRMHDTAKTPVKYDGRIMFQGQNVVSPQTDTVSLRARIGMVFQKPNPFPKSIFDNVAYGIKIHGLHDSKDHLSQLVEEALVQVGLWGEVSGKLSDSGTQLSGGQQQRLCIARAIAINPEVILMDEPCSALDPISTSIIEELMAQLKEMYSILIVTHNMHQAVRACDYIAMMEAGELLEFGTSEELSVNAQHEQTRNYLMGRYG